MSNFVRLKSGVDVPTSSLVDNGWRVHSAFTSYPGSMIGFVNLVEHDFKTELIDQYMPDKYAYNIFEDEELYDFHMGAVPRSGKISNVQMARTALAYNMVVTLEDEAYLQEPLQSDRRLLPQFYTLHTLESAN
jgi:hypothetical protein